MHIFTSNPSISGIGVPKQRSCGRRNSYSLVDSLALAQISALVIAAAMTFPAFASASAPLGSTQQQLAPSPSDLTLRWSYEALGTDGSFRIYRYDASLRQELIADLPVVNGPQSYSYVDQGSRPHFAVYELRYVHRNGQEEKLRSALWQPPVLFPEVTLDASRAQVWARLSSSSASPTWEPHLRWSQETEDSSLCPPLPVVPPPRRALA